MSRKQKPLPYLLKIDRHGNRRARTRIPRGNGTYQEIALGEYRSPESRAKLAELQVEWEQSLLAGRNLQPGLTVADLVAAFLTRHAAIHYRDRHGKQTSEYRCYLQHVKPLLAMHKDTAARNFGPLALKAVRAEMVRRGWVRKSINKAVDRIRRIWKWGASEQLLPTETYQALRTVPGLAQGRTEAVDNPPVSPADPSVVEAVLAHARPMIADMVRVQLLAGMRPQDVCGLTGAEIDRTGIAVEGVTIWIYRPSAHKTAWRGQSRAIALGPQAQAILGPYVVAAGGGPLFRSGTGAAITPKWYQESLRLASQKARVAGFHAHQLRHSAATAIQHEYGLDGARAVLGHRDANVTQVYAARDMQLAAEIARRLG